LGKAYTYLSGAGAVQMTPLLVTLLVLTAQLAIVEPRSRAVDSEWVDYGGKVFGWLGVPGVSPSISSPCRHAVSFCGCSCPGEDAQAWAWNVLQYGMLREGYNVSNVWAATGPLAGNCSGLEVDPTAIVQYLVNISDKCLHQPNMHSMLVVYAVSAGAHVAARFLAQLANVSSTWLNRTIYFDLEGGSEPPPKSVVTQLFRFYPSSAFSDSGLKAPYWNDMIHMWEGLPNRAFLPFNQTESNCLQSCCMHMSMVQRKPYNLSGCCLQDYYEVTPLHPVQTKYLNMTQDALQELFDLE